MKILYIDDDSTSAIVVQEMLATAGVDVASASSAREGLALFEQAEFDLVLTDLRMPEMNGLTAIRRLRAFEKRSKPVPIVVVSAELTAGARELCGSAGANASIEKPVMMPELFRILGAAMEEDEGFLVH